MATQQKKTGRDYPLSPTPEPMRTDNTSVNKVNYKNEKIYPTASFEYKNTSYTPKDSSDYKEGYKYGIKRVSSNSQNAWGEKYEKGRESVGLNDRFNEGFSEGKDRVLDKKSKKK